jgi:folate-dependent phosphoribosylglycinamide formyltransferase PurN
LTDTGLAVQVDQARVVLLTGEGLEHLYVARVLTRSFPNAVKAIVVARPVSGSLLTRIRGYTRRYSAMQLGSRLTTRAYQAVTKYGARREEALARILFDNDCPTGHERSDLVRFVVSHNDAQTLQLLDEVKPHIIAVYGTGIIRRDVIRRASVGILNMHTGLSPEYRGSDSVFWAIHNQEPHRIGVTLHLLDEGVDSGAILATDRPSIQREDDEHTLFAKCVQIGAARYADAVARVLDGRATPVVQDLQIGRSYRFVDRSVRAEWRVARLIRRGVLARYASKQA